MIFFTGHYCCISVAEVEPAEKRRHPVTTAVIILLQQDIDLHELPGQNESKKLQGASGRQHHMKSLCQGISSLTQTMHLSCVFRRCLYLWMPNDSRRIIYLIGEMNHSYLSLNCCQLIGTKKAARSQSGSLVMKEGHQTDNKRSL